MRATKDMKKEGGCIEYKKKKRSSMKLRGKSDEKRQRQKVYFRFPLYIMRAASICQRQMD